MNFNSSDSSINLAEFILQMANNAARIHSLAMGISPEQSSWKPDPESWSILETINHLYDEEKEDFRPHLDCVMNHKEKPWQEINPGTWVTERGYNQREIGTSIASFLSEREGSLAWLKGLDHADWESSHSTPFGAILAGEVFAAWVAHDLLHMRQLIELHWAYTVKALQPYQTRYAGEW
jgi:hypothetical protein